MRKTAVRDTRLILSPKLLATLPSEPAHRWTTLPDGRVAILSMPDDHSVLISTPNGDQIERLTLEPKFKYWNLEWHSDSNHQLWIYALGRSNAKSASAWEVYRYKWGSNASFTLVAIPAGYENDHPRELLSFGPGYLLLTLGGEKALNLATSPAELISPCPVFSKTTATVDKDGNLITCRGFPYPRTALREAVLTAASSRTYVVSADEDQIYVLRGPERGPRILKKPENRVDFPLSLFEAPNGELYVAVILALSNEDAFPERKSISIYRPAVTNQPVDSLEFEVDHNYGRTKAPHFFVGPHGRVLFGYDAKGRVSIRDIEAHSEVASVPDEGTIEWYDTATQTYLSNGKHIFQMLSEANP